MIQAEKTENPPALYDLTSLQREANRVLGYTAQQTLDYTQAFYEKKLVTYPRTDSRSLTEDMKGMLPELVESVAKTFLPDAGSVPVSTKRVINNKKVIDGWNLALCAGAALPPCLHSIITFL